MSITQIIVLATAAILLGQIGKYRAYALLAFSVFVIYWLQPVQLPVTFTFWLPTFTLLLIVFFWFYIIRDHEATVWQSLPALVILSAIVVLVGANRYFRLEGLFITDTPRIQWIGIAVAAMLSPTLLIVPLRRTPFWLYLVAIVGLLALLVIIKLPILQTQLFDALSTIRGKETSPGWVSLSWLGFSYIAFRLMHTVLDKRAGRLPRTSLVEYINYVIFFPSITAGPIDRIERFNRDMKQPAALDSQGWLDAGTRFFTGLFKKFVLADGLAWIALNEYFARDLQSAGPLWLLLYAYSLRIYFDFSGYTDMAIGLGRFMGVRLPENFSAPYLKPNLTLFWNSWHMTLTQWFRSYLFNPLTRILRSNNSTPSYLVILTTQVITMLTIGLWHGISLNFVLWGLWHGIGLFIQNRWSYLLRERASPDALTRPVRRGRLDFINIFLTFNYVSLSWLFFMLPTPDLAWQAMMKLMGLPL
jgi:alginate O-acetyltransferase complex protein AlgI